MIIAGLQMMMAAIEDGEHQLRALIITLKAILSRARDDEEPFDRSAIDTALFLTNELEAQVQILVDTTEKQNIHTKEE